MTALLPADFAMLERFTESWAGETSNDRARIRDRASREEARAFYEAMQPHVGPALDFLDARPLAEHGEQDRRLMRLLLTYAHIAIGIEIQREDEPAHAKLRAHMPILRAPADAVS